MMPRPFAVTDARRAREEAARLAERRDGSRRQAAGSIPAGGKLTLEGGIDVDGGDISVVDGGVVRVYGEAVNPADNMSGQATASIESRNIMIPASAAASQVPGMFFETDFSSGGSVSSLFGDDPTLRSGTRAMHGPGAGPNIIKSSVISAAPTNASIYASASDSTINDWNATKSSTTILARPDSFYVELWEQVNGSLMRIDASVGDPKLYLYAKNGVDVSGPFTVDGQPVTGGSGKLLIFRRNASLNLASGYLGNVPWDAAEEDATLYGADAGRMYAPIAGVYAFSCFITINDPTKTGNRQVVVKKNGVNYTGIAGPPVTGASFAGSFSTPIRMAAGDYLEIVAYQNSGATSNLYPSSGGNSYNNASMQWLRP